MLGPILRAASYGNERISPSVVAFSEKMMHDTPIATLVEFLRALEVHDETAALPTLADEAGMVRGPAMSMSDQMTSLIQAQRGFQASVQVTKNAQDTYNSALQIGRG